MTLTTTTIQQGINPTKLSQGNLFTYSKWKQMFGCIISKKGKIITVMWFNDNDKSGSICIEIYNCKAFKISEGGFWREI